MKSINLIAIVLLMGSFSFAQEKGTFTDSRDGKKYKTVKIGKQTWMAENLNYEMEESFCYEEKPEKCREYGRLYSLKAALESCPDGWRLPTVEDYMVLMGKAKEVSYESMMKRYPPICTVLEKQQHDLIEKQCKNSPNYNSLAFDLKLHSGSFSYSKGWKGEKEHELAYFWTSSQIYVKKPNYSIKETYDYLTAYISLSSNENLGMSIYREYTNDLVQDAMLQSVRCIKISPQERKGEKVKYTGDPKAYYIGPKWELVLKETDKWWKEHGF